LTTPPRAAIYALHITRNRASRRRQTDEEAQMAQITLTLPDGNARQYDAGITAGDVANDISKSLG